MRVGPPEDQGASMVASRRQLVVGLVSVIAAGVIVSVWWPFRSREFRGTLCYTPNLMTIPEDPPSLVSLVTPAGSYELSMGGSAWRLPDRLLDRGLREMNGKEVIVRGRWGLRRASRWSRPTRPSRRSRWVIHVYDLRLATPTTSTAPAGRSKELDTSLRKGASPAAFLMVVPGEPSVALSRLMATTPAEFDQRPSAARQGRPAAGGGRWIDGRRRPG